jgi:hypothetical protein
MAYLDKDAAARESIVDFYDNVIEQV